MTNAAAPQLFRSAHATCEPQQNARRTPKKLGKGGQTRQRSAAPARGDASLRPTRESASPLPDRHTAACEHPHAAARAGTPRPIKAARCSRVSRPGWGSGPGHLPGGCRRDAREVRQWWRHPSGNPQSPAAGRSGGAPTEAAARGNEASMRSDLTGVARTARAARRAAVAAAARISDGVAGSAPPHNCCRRIIRPCGSLCRSQIFAEPDRLPAACSRRPPQAAQDSHPGGASARICWRELRERRRRAACGPRLPWLLP